MIAGIDFNESIQNFYSLYQHECLECGAEIISEGYCSKDCSDASWL